MKRNLYPLKGKTIVVTGVSRRQGIGYAIARHAAALGASVVIHHYQSHDKNQPWGADHLNNVFNGIQSELVGDARFAEFSGDFQDPDYPKALIKQITETVGHIDALVCNHALSGSDGPLGELTAEMIDNHYAINTRSSLLLTQSFVKQYQPDKGRGKVIFLTSGQRQGPMPGEIAYAASKGALAEITLTLADQLADENIAINTINPGPVDTGYLDEKTWKSVRQKFPFGRFGEPEDPARLITWLLTDEADWITGQIINTEGGFARWQ